MMLFIQENIEYPVVSVEKGEQGVVYVQFVVAKDGTIELIKIVRSVSDALDEETIRMIKKMPKWNPGIYHGRLVRVRYTLPVHFRLG